MATLYVCEQGIQIGIRENCVEVRKEGQILQSIPVETLEAIRVLGHVQLTAELTNECLKRDIDVLFMSFYGVLLGKLTNPDHVNVERQRRQALIKHNDPFAIGMAKQCIRAKIKNQTTLMRRYSRSKGSDITRQISDMLTKANKLQKTKDPKVLLGYEGSAADLYFKTIGAMLPKEFKFEKRTRRPPEDPFNALLCFGYSVLFNEIYAMIEAKGLNAYFGFLHKDKLGHPALVSDLMEEWRAVIIDSLALSMIMRHELTINDFYKFDGHGVAIERSALRKIMAKYETKMNSDCAYLKDVDYPLNFREALEIQVNRYVEAMENGDFHVYKPIVLR